MVIPHIFIALTLAATTASLPEEARLEFNRCFAEFHNQAVDDQISVSAFGTKVEVACEAERKAYYDAIVKSELGFGSSDAEAKEYAGEEVKLMTDGIKADFALNRDQRAKLVLE